MTALRPNPTAMNTPLHHLDATVLDERIAGRNLTGDTFGAELGDAPSTVVFLRHYG